MKTFLNLMYLSLILIYLVASNNAQKTSNCVRTTEVINSTSSEYEKTLCLPKNIGFQGKAVDFCQSFGMRIYQTDTSPSALSAASDFMKAFFRNNKLQLAWIGGKKDKNCQVINGIGQTSFVDCKKFARLLCEFEYPGSKILPRPFECGVPEDNRIAGGDKTRIREFPWMAALMVTEKGQKVLRCGGALISKRYVLTTASCAKVGKLVNLTHVRLGEWDLSTTNDCDNGTCSTAPQDLEIEEVDVHGKYQPFRKNFDVALVRLKTPAVYSAFVKPICLPLDEGLRNMELKDEKMTLSGWGATENTTISNKLLKVVLEGVSNEQCKKNNTNLADTMFCTAPKRGVDYCKGDEGDPLVDRNIKSIPSFFFLTGLASSGTNFCGRLTRFGRFTKVADIMEFVNNNVKP